MPSAAEEAVDRALDRGLDVSQALHQVCEELDVERGQHRVDWRMVLPIARERFSLDLGGGTGDALAFAGSLGARCLALTPSPTVARLLGRRDAPHLAVGVVRRLEALPMATGSIHSLFLDERSAAGFSVKLDDVGAVARELARVVAADGAIVLGRSSIASRLRPGRARAGALDELLRGDARRTWFVRAVERELEILGFEIATHAAPIPDEQRCLALVDLEDRLALGYFFDHFPRRNSFVRRLLQRVASFSARAGLLPLLLPYHYRVFRRVGR